MQMEVNRIREAAERQERLHSAKEQRLNEEARKSVRGDFYLPLTAEPPVALLDCAAEPQGSPTHS